MAEAHKLKMLCRVCGGRLQKAKGRAPVHKCTTYSEDLKAAFSLSIDGDDPDIHPQVFCNRCFAAMKRHSAAASKGLPYHHSIVVFSWENHTEGECTVRKVKRGEAEGLIKY